MYRENNRHFQLFGGEPIKLRWGPWVTDTYLLQRDGWKFHADENFDMHSSAHIIHLACTAPDNNLVVSGRLYIRRDEMMGERYHYDRWERPVEMQQYSATRDYFRVIGSEEMGSWQRMQQVDLTERCIVNERTIAMRDFKMFQPCKEATTNDIYIPPQSVDALFNEILKIQYPQQQEIKKGLILPQAKPIFKAKVYTLAEAA
jgi:hypothetical protein